MQPTVVLASASPVKRAAVAKFFNVPPQDIQCVPCTTLDLPPQPVNSGAACVLVRLHHLQATPHPPGSYLVAIENEVWKRGDNVVHQRGGAQRKVDALCGDVCHVAVSVNDEQLYGKSDAVPFAAAWLALAEERSARTDYATDGLSITVGQMMHAEDATVEADDWIGRVQPLLRRKYDCRERQILAAMHRALPHATFRANVLANRVTIVPDFPKPGVRFQDLSALLAHGRDWKALVQAMCAVVSEERQRFDKVVGLDARGFIYGAALAHVSGAGFVMARKAGKLPGSGLLKTEYATEYSRATLQLLPGAIQPGDAVVVCDDLVATGGSLCAACDLVALAGGRVVACVVVLAVPPLLPSARALLGDTPLIVVLPEPRASGQ